MRKKSCIICQKPHTNSMSKTCSPWCQRKHQVNLDAKKRAESRVNVRIQWVDEEDRDSLREVVINAVWPFLKTRQIQIKVSKGKTKTTLQKLEKKADDLWSLAVKLNYNSRCAYSWGTDNLNSHHIESRTHRPTRWDIENGICLTSNHHTFSQVFSAHKTPAKFTAWLRDTKWDKYVDDLHRKSRGVLKVTEEFLLETIKELEDFIEKCQ